MAVGGSDGSIVLKTAVEMAGLKKGLSSMKSLTASAGKALGAVSLAAAGAAIAITKMATSAYADYEQLVGGVETLFKDSAGKVMEYANQAFATTGLSANEYMQNVTTFSASLLNSLGGDTERAADVANAALISISDNVNKMGSDYESVQLAFQGFAKQQYMLLDNLKLGYGGTKTEMERLLKDAQAITGVEYNIDNLADVYTAIGVIQEKLGIAGTTAKEAATTISGSAAMMKASWQNVLIAISGGGDLDRAIQNLVYSIQTYMGNIVPVIERSLQGIGLLIEKVAPMLVETVAKSLIQALPSLLNAVYKMIIGLANGVVAGIKSLFSETTRKVAMAQGEEIESAVESQNALTEAVEETEKAQKGALAGFDEINQFTTETAEAQEEIAMMSGGGGLVPSESAVAASGQSTGNAWAAGFIRGIIERIQSSQLWTNILYPILSDVKRWSVEIFATLGDAFANFKEKIIANNGDIQTVIFGIMTALELFWGFVSQVFDAIVESLGPVLNNMGDAIMFIVSSVADAFRFISEIFLAIVALIEGDTEKATEHFGNAMTALVNFFINAINAIIAVLNGFINLAWGLIKGLVNGIGGIAEKIGNLIGKDWGWNWQGKAPQIPYIPKVSIPKLAQGAVIPANKEFLAVLGDQKSGTNVEAPLDTIKQALAEVMAMNTGFNGKIEVPVYLDGKRVAVAVRGANESMGTQTVFGGFASVY